MTELLEKDTLPNWDDAWYPYFAVPLLSQLFMIVLWQIFAKLYKRYSSMPLIHRLARDYIGCIDQPVPRQPQFVKWMLLGQIAISLWSVAVFIYNSIHWRYGVNPLAKHLQFLQSLFFLFFRFVLVGFKEEFRFDSLFTINQLVDILTVPQPLLPGSLGNIAGGGEWITLDFLRTIQALDAYLKLDSIMKLGRGVGELWHEMTFVGLKFVTLVACFAGCVYLCEILGDVAWFTDSLITTQMGQISFFRMLYWIIETISTVGYGDYAPSTFPSQLVTMVCMLSGVAFFGIELERVSAITSRTKKGSGVYNRSARNHVIMIGGGVKHPDETLMLAFMDEIYHPAYRKTWPDLVFLSNHVESIESVRNLLEHSIESEVQHRITYLVGTSLDEHDLQRCSIETSSLVLIVANTLGFVDPIEEDKENLLRALSLSRDFPKVQMRLMLLMPESKETALQIGIPTTSCFSVNEMKSNLFWQSCRCRGWTTLLSNLMITSDSDIASEQDMNNFPWLREYIDGMDQEVYGFLAAEQFHGLPFRKWCIDVYQKASMCIFAAQIGGKIILAPLQQLRYVDKETVFFVLAPDDTALKDFKVPDSETNWRDVFLEKRMAFQNHFENVSAPTSDDGSSLMARDATGSLASFMAGPTTDGTGSLAPQQLRNATLQQRKSIRAGLMGMDSSFGREKSTNSVAFGSLSMAAGAASVGFKSVTRKSVFSTVLPTPLPTPGLMAATRRSTRRAGLGFPDVSNVLFAARLSTPLLEGIDEDDGRDSSRQTLMQTELIAAERRSKFIANCQGRASKAVKIRSQDLNPQNAKIDADIKEELEQKATDIIDEADNHPFTLILNLSGQWHHVAHFIVHSRAEYLPFQMPIIILGMQEPPAEVADQLELVDNDENSIGFVLGSPSWVPDLIRAGVMECSIIVCPSEQATATTATGGERTAMLDADVVVLHRVLETLGVSDKSLILEFKRIHNIRLLPNVSPSQGGSVSVHQATEKGSPPQKSGGLRSFLSPAFLTNLLLGGASDATTTLPHWCDPRFASGMIFTQQVLGSLLARAFHTPGIVEVMQALAMPDEDDLYGIFPWLISLPSRYTGITFGELFSRLVEDSVHPVMPVGLYRAFDPKAANGNQADGYVLTVPDVSVVIHSSDFVYVLGDRQFGSCAYDQGLLPLSGSGDSDSVSSGRTGSKGRS